MILTNQLTDISPGAATNCTTNVPRYERYIFKTIHTNYTHKVDHDANFNFVGLSYEFLEE